MKKNKVCWKVTTKCNQNCKYCYGFNNIKDLSYDENIKVLDNLIAGGLTHITWTGGEAILYPYFKDLLEASNERGIHNKLVTNGIYLAQNNNEYTDYVLNTLEEIDLSIDSVSNDINVSLGKENNHLDIVKKVLEKIKNRPIRVGINTVVSKKNIDKLNELGEFLNKYSIYKWKFLKFMPLRERALTNKELFEVSENELIHNISELQYFKNIENTLYKVQKDFEKSIVILPDARIIRTDNGKDIELGNALKDNVTIFNNSQNNPIKVFIMYANDSIRNNIVNTIKELDYVEIIGTAKDNNEAYEKMTVLKPELVFSSYNYDLVRKSKEKLQDSFPCFNTIGELSGTELDTTVKIIGNKLNASVRQIDDVKSITQAYKEFKNQ